MPENSPIAPIADSLPLAWEQALKNALGPGESLQLVAHSGSAAVAASESRVYLVREGAGLAAPAVWSAPWQGLRSVATLDTTLGGALRLELRDPSASPPGGLEAPFTILDRVKYEAVARWIDARIASTPAIELPGAGARCRCGAEIRAHAAYCPACGTALGRFCPGCLHVVSEGDRFCATCGLAADLALPVQCTGCGGRLAPGGLWCPTCGKRALDVCPECGSRAVMGWTYCPYCAHRSGTPVEAPASVGGPPMDLPPWAAPAAPATVSDAEALNQRGAEAYERDDYTQAAQLFRDASDLDPNEPLYLTNLSAALDELGDDSGAEDALKRALAIDGTNLNTLMSYGTYFAERERPSDAARMWRRVIEIGPNTEEAGEAARSLSHLGEI